MGAEPVGAALVGLQVVEGVLDVFECVAVVVAVGLRVAGDHAAGVLELAMGVLEPAARVVLGVLFVGVLAVEVLFVGDGGADRRDLWFGAAHPLGKHGQRAVLGGLLEGELFALGLGVGGVDVGVLAGAGERDITAFLGGVFGDDQVGGVACVALGGERVLHVGEPDARFVGLGAGEPGGAAV